MLFSNLDIKSIIKAIFLGILFGFLCSQLVYAKSISVAASDFVINKYFGSTWMDYTYVTSTYRGYSAFEFSKNVTTDSFYVSLEKNAPLLDYYDFMTYSFSFNATSDAVFGQPILQVIQGFDNVSCIYTQSSTSAGGSYNVNINAYCPVNSLNQVSGTFITVKHSSAFIQTIFSGSLTFYDTKGKLNTYFEQLNGSVDKNNQLLQELISKLSSFNSQAIIDNQNQNTQKEIDNANKNAEQAHKDSQANTDAINGVNSSLNNSDSSEAQSSADSFFSGFESDDFGLSSIVTAPLNLITSITSSTCKSIGFPAPFVNQTIELPCMKPIYEKHFGDFFKLYQTITFGIVAYWVSVNIFFMVKGFKDPDSDKIEVLDL